MWVFFSWFLCMYVNTNFDRTLFCFKNDDTALDRYGHAMLHGSGYNRWFDKSFTLVVCPNGRVSVVCVFLSVWVHLWVCVCVCVCVHVFVCVGICVCVCTHACMSEWVCVYMCAYFFILHVNVFKVFIWNIHSLSTVCVSLYQCQSVVCTSANQ